MKQYVLGFYFSEDGGRVVMIHKTHPPHLAGKWNGVGGKIEDGETPKEAMRREFKEEAGVDHDKWEFLFSFEVNDEAQIALIHVFRGFGDVTRVYTCTDEMVAHYALDKILFLGGLRTTNNMKWLLPMVADNRLHDGSLTLLMPQRARIKVAA